MFGEPVFAHIMNEYKVGKSYLGSLNHLMVQLEAKILEFFELQGQRSNVYKQFETGFDLYINGEAKEHEYQQLIITVQGIFVSISSKIRDLIQSLQEPFKSHVEEIQRLEKQKLQSTVVLQSFMHETKYGDRDMTVDAEIEKRNWQSIVDSITQQLEEMHAIAVECTKTTSEVSLVYS
jgi:hypothetical protein